MNIVRYRSWPGAVLQREFGIAAARSGHAHPQHAGWSPRMDVREEAERFVILADVPGIDPAQIDIQMDGNVLSIQGQRQAEALPEQARQVQAERGHGHFQRRFALPEGIDADAIVASGRHGILEISIPKKPQAAPRRIQVGGQSVQ